MSAFATRGRPQTIIGASIDPADVELPATRSIDITDEIQVVPPATKWGTSRGTGGGAQRAG